MDLGIKGQAFIVTGASSGLGKAVAERLLEEGAEVLVIARRKELLEQLETRFPGQLEAMTSDVRDPDLDKKLAGYLSKKQVKGVFVNAGGPPAKSIAETMISDWDEAYRLLIRWKIMLVSSLLPYFEERSYGRILFSESSSVKQPVENLVLSNSFRMAVVGFSKTICQEYARKGITSNVIGPGHHDTEAVKRLFVKKSEQAGISVDQARIQSVSQIPVRKMGEAFDFATLAAWLLSPLAGFVTGQVFFIEGGTIKSSL